MHPLALGYCPTWTCLFSLPDCIITEHRAAGMLSKNNLRNKDWSLTAAIQYPCTLWECLPRKGAHIAKSLWEVVLHVLHWYHFQFSSNSLKLWPVSATGSSNYHSNNCWSIIPEWSAIYNVLSNVKKPYLSVIVYWSLFPLPSPCKYVRPHTINLYFSIQMKPPF